MTTSEAIDAVAREVARHTEVKAGVVALIHALAAHLAELKDEPEQIDMLATRLRAVADVLAEAIASNTVAADEPASLPSAIEAEAAELSPPGGTVPGGTT